LLWAHPTTSRECRTCPQCNNKANSCFLQDCWSFQAQHCSHECPDREAEVAKNSRAQPCPGCCYKMEFHLLYVDQWDLLLKLLQMATTALCAEKTVSASLTCPVVDGLLKHHLKIKEDDLGAVIAFKEAVSQELVCRFQFDKDNVAVLAAAVDPRHSHLTCFTLRSSHRCRTFFLRRCNT